MKKILLTSCALMLPLTGWLTPAFADEQTREVLDTEVKVKVKISYLLSLPDGYAKDGKKWPLLVFLHGAGERGDNLDRVKVHGPPKLVSQGKKLPFIVLSPQCPRGRWWDTFTIVQLIDHIARTHRVDEDRIYLTGLSMGGFGTWNLAAKYPNKFAAIAPICGGGDAMYTRLYKHLPVWVFHGGKDGVVPIARSQQMVDALKRQGCDVKFTVYPEAGHDSWTKSYDNPELYAWFLKHKRKQPGKS